MTVEAPISVKPMAGTTEEMLVRAQEEPARGPSLAAVLGCIVLVVIAYGFLIGASIGACLENVRPTSGLDTTCETYKAGPVRVALLAGPVGVVLLSALGSNGWGRLRTALLALAGVWCVLLYVLTSASMA